MMFLKDGHLYLIVKDCFTSILSSGYPLWSVVSFQESNDKLGSREFEKIQVTGAGIGLKIVISGDGFLFFRDDHSSIFLLR